VVLGVLVAVAAVGGGCARKLERTLVAPEASATLDDESRYLKVHMRDGGLYVLTDWSVDEERRVVTGVGDRFDARRAVIDSGTARIRLDQVVLFETNVVKTPGAVAGMAVVTGLSVAITAACLANPKACFGSCPTFYVQTDAGRELLSAEGFSASIAPSLEARDIDHLFRARPRGRELVVRLTNEAYETHVIRYARLIAARRPPGGRVLATADGRLIAATRLEPVSSCRAEEGRCSQAVRAMDGVERSSLTDGRDLASREVIELELPAGDGERGLVIGARQTFLTTYLFYQMLSYLGRSAGDALAALERRGGRTGDGSINMLGVLGGIAVEVDGEEVGLFDETGPLAADVQLVPLPRGARRVTLRVARGHYRIDLLAVATLAGPAEAVELEPAAASRGGVPDRDALARLRGGDRQLVTMPGAEYRVSYRLPEGELDLFLASRGYYLEWMRQEWLREESRPRAALFLLQPRLSLVLLAPAFKKVEHRMEEMFWRSRYAPPRRGRDAR
jgi:hypothetical protein